jgi:glycerophosphoryl diester phosphodiesterase
MLVRWETIPPPFRTIFTENQSDTLGVLPINHPKRVGGTSTWIDRKLCTPTGGSEFRLTVGTDKFHPSHSVSIREKMKPEKIGLRLRWGKGDKEPLKSFSQSGGNIQCRRVKFITEMEEEEKREEEHRAKLVTHSSTSCTVFKFNADYAKLTEQTHYGSNWLELDVIDLDLNAVVGTSHISLAYFIDPAVTQGSFRSSVFAYYRTPQMEPIGDVFVDFLVVHPFVGKLTGAPRLEHCYRQYWTGIHNSQRETLDIGHRGLGRSYKNVEAKAEIRENTLLSFSEAGKLGAEYVELDIMLTKDRVPVVFHDFDIGVKGEAKKFESNLNSGRGQQSLAIQISELTLAQLKALKTTGTDSDDFASNTQSIKSFKSSLNLVDAGVKVGEKEELISVPTLEQLLTELPDWLGLNVEIKYPVELPVEWLNKMPQYEINDYLDAILEPLFAHVGKRRIVFSCFHPNVCIALMQKQPRFPVCFLTGEDPSHFRDRRCCSLEAAVAFAQAEYLLGIVTNSEVLFRDENNVPTNDEAKMVGRQCVASLRKKGKIIWTWGDLNTFPGWVELQRRWGVDAVICDSVHKLVRKDKHKSIFKEEFTASIEKHISKLSAADDEVQPLPDSSSSKTDGDGSLGLDFDDDIGLSLSPLVSPLGGDDVRGIMSPLALAATAATAAIAGGVAAMTRNRR